MQMGERPALQQCQENDRLQPPGSNSLTFATKSAQCRSAALAASRQLSHQETGHPRLWMMARVTNEKDGYRE
jgi:hypothetical protein